MRRVEDGEEETNCPICDVTRHLTKFYDTLLATGDADSKVVLQSAVPVVGVIGIYHLP